MKISLIQMNSGDNIEKNFEKAKKFALDSVRQKADILVFSELFLYRGENPEIGMLDLNSKYIKYFQSFAKDNNVNIVLGSISLKVKNTKRDTNTCLIINKKGEIIHRYDKIHMFKVNNKKLSIDENDFSLAGKDFGIFELDGIKMGVGICFDLRFPNYFQKLISKNAEIIFLPSSFRKHTGNIARNILTRARAIENQIFVCACGQTGGSGVKERCGNSQVINYKGEIIDNIEKDEGIIVCNIDLEEQREFRKSFPVLEQIKKT